MTLSHRAALAAALPLALLAGCTDHPAPTPDTQLGAPASAGSSSGLIQRIARVHNGFGPILPHRTEQLDGAGNPTGSILSIRFTGDVRRHVSATSGILPPRPFPVAAVDRNGQPSNHFFAVELTAPIDPESVFDLQTGTLARSLSLTTVAPASGVTVEVPARVLVGGVAMVAGPNGPELETWATVDPATGLVQALVPEAAGLPSGTSRARLLAPTTIVLIADSDGDLSTLEPFPQGARVDLRIGAGIESVDGETLEDPGYASVTVGPDSDVPSIALNGAFAPDVQPANGATGVDPETDVLVRFSEPVQPYSVGMGFGLDGPLSSSGPSTAVTIGVASSAAYYEVDLVSPFDLSRYRLVPTIAFPGEPAVGAPTSLNLVSAELRPGTVQDLSVNGTQNSGAQSWSFRTGPGTRGLVNAPVVPEAVVVLGSAATADTAGVLDLNGFGASTGNPVSSQPFPLEGESRFPYDPNVTFNPIIRPALTPGTTSIDGGSAGVFTLTRDSNLSTSLLREGAIESLTDAHVGQPLDASFSNASLPFGCQAGGGNLCALDGLKVINPSLNTVIDIVVPTSGAFSPLQPGYPNLVSWAPHPNPPPLTFPPLCVSPSIPGESPSSVFPFTNNLLVFGNPFPDPQAGTPPFGKLVFQQNAYFGGPRIGVQQLADCNSHFIRQQVGHFLYVADRDRGQIVVINSNSMEVIDRIAVPDPVDLAMSPNVDLLAVSNALADSVTFIDINPNSSFFNQIVNFVQVGSGPHGIAWSPDNEQILVCNELGGSLSLISAATLQLEKTVTVPSGAPFQVIVTERELGYGFNRGVHYGYVLDRSGVVSVYESGPDGTNGWGYDDIIGELPWTFLAPKALALDLPDATTSFIVAHEGKMDLTTGQSGMLGDGALTRVRIDLGLSGLQPIPPGSMPQFRSLFWGLTDSIAESDGRLTGIPVDLAFDEMNNISGLPDEGNLYSAGSPLPANGKGLIRSGALNQRTVRPRFLMAAIADAGVIDVLENGALFDTNPYAAGVQPAPAPGVRSLVTYWRQ